MKISLKLPLFGMNMEEGTVSLWHRAPGDAFRKGEPLYDVETEKVTTTVEAPCDGRLLEIVAAEQTVVAVGEIVCQIDSTA